MKPLELPEAWLPELRACSAEQGLDFLCTAFDERGLDSVAGYVKYFKVASFEMSDAAFLRAHNRYEQSVIFSTGMATQREVIEAASQLDRVRAALHCTSSYPAPIDEANLLAMTNMGVECETGLSDHSGDPLTGAIATALGARVLEVHIRDYEGSSPDDGPHALKPNAFAQMVDNVRRAERMLGTGVKGLQPSETESARFRVR